MKHLIPVIVILLLVSSSFVGISHNIEKSTASYNGNTLYVGGSGPGNYTKIQDAVDDASNGDTVFVYNGTYIEYITVDKSINLIGENKNTTKIFCDYDEYVSILHITSDWVNISGFTIEHDYQEYDFYGIILDSCNNRISDNILFDNWCAIYFTESSSNNTIADNIFKGDIGWSVIYGVHLSDSNNDNVIRNNTFLYLWTAIDISHSCNNIISDNYILDDAHGILINSGCSNNLISENILINIKCCTGIGISSSDENIIIDNTIATSTFGSSSIRLADSNKNIVISNSISNCGNGIFLWGSSKNILSCNHITSCNFYGITTSISFFCKDQKIKSKDLCFKNIHFKKLHDNYFGKLQSDSSNNNFIHHNNFINNSENAKDEFINNWDNSIHSGGNYWDDYDGTDEDGDGIGDTPYNISGGENQDRYPLMGCWEGNLIPIAKFTWTPSHPEPGEEIVFNASKSMDFDGYVKLYKWDWDNDGEYDEYSYYPIANYTFEEIGYYPVTLIITDNGSGIGSITKTVRVGNFPPYVPSNPEPPDDATNVTPGCVKWSGGDPDNDLVLYDVYFGVSNPPSKAASNISETEYCAFFWELNATYYWKIVSWDNFGASTEGPIWQFTTRGNKPPESPTIDGTKKGKVGMHYNYTFQSTDPDGDDIYYHICWGDKEIIYIYGPYPSGDAITLSYNWTQKGTYVIQCKSRDIFDSKSGWSYLEVTMPQTFWWLNGLLDRLPLLQKMLEVLII